jgi:putative aldouronate transport system substrate-binding protein
MNKRGLILLLAMILLISTVIGCSGGNSVNNGSSGSTGSENKGTSENNSPEGNDTEPVEFSISMRTLNVTHVEQHPDINKDKYLLALEEMTNADLDIQLIPHAEYQDKMVQMFATNAIPDVVQGGGGLFGNEMAGSVEAGVFLRLNELLEEHGKELLEIIPDASWERVTDHEGNIWAIPEYLGNPSRRATWIRKDLLDKVDMPVPTTVAETLDVLRAFKEIGVEQPFAGRDGFKYADTFFGAYDVIGDSNQWELVDGKMQPKFLNVENMEKAIQTYKTMFDEGLMSKEFTTINPTMFKNNILSGKAGMWSMNANELPIWGPQFYENVPDGELILISSPTGTDSHGGYKHYSPNTRSFFINKEAEDKAAGIIKFFSWMTTDDAELFFSFGLEGEGYTLVDGKPQYIEPEGADAVNVQRYLNYWLWMVHDTTYNEMVLGQTEEGQELIKFYKNVLDKEGHSGYEFTPPLETLKDNPDLDFVESMFPVLLQTHIYKMIYGQQELDWEPVIAEYMKKGGDKIIQEATERYESGVGVYSPLRK